MNAILKSRWYREGRFIYALNNQRAPSNSMYFQVYGGWSDNAGVRVSREELDQVAVVLHAAPQMLADLESVCGIDFDNITEADMAKVFEARALLREIKGAV